MMFTPQDDRDITEEGKLVNFIDRIDESYVEKTSEEIFERQPLFLSAFLSYHEDSSPQELEEIMKIFFLIWEYFRENQNVQTKEISESYFDTFRIRSVLMWAGAEREPSETQVTKIYEGDLEKLKSKTLIAAIFFRTKQRPVLAKMDARKSPCF